MKFDSLTLTRHNVRLAFITVLLCIVATSCGDREPTSVPVTPIDLAIPAPPRPNILIVIIDTLRQDALRAYDANAQPLDALDAFSQRAAVFENALAPSSWTLPSVTTLLTGKYPDRHGAAHPRLALPERFATIATAAKDAGYETIAFSDGVYVSPQFGLARGFDWFNDTAAPDARPIPDLPRAGAVEDVPGTALFDRGLHYLRTRDDGGKPFLLLLHTYSVHDYFREHPWAVAEVNSNVDLGSEGLYCLIDRKFCVDGAWEYFIQLYNAEVRRMNAAFAEVMRALDDLGLTDSTYVLFTSDHSEGFEPKRDRVHHGGRLHEDVVRIPFLLAGPDVTPQRIADPVSLIDVMPTFLDLFDAEIPANVEGISLLPRLAGNPIAPRPIFASEYFYWWQDGKREDVTSIAVFPLAEAVLDGGRWFTRHQASVELSDFLPGTPPLRPEEVSATVAAMTEILRKRDTRLQPGDSRAEDEELQEKLRSLGYVE